jgi:hypothetical protein
VRNRAGASVGPACRAITHGKAKIFYWRTLMIKKTSGGYKVVSEKGNKNLGGPYKTKAEAEKRLRQVEFFKHKGGK